MKVEEEKNVQNDMVLPESVKGVLKRISFMMSPK